MSTSTMSTNTTDTRSPLRDLIQELESWLTKLKQDGKITEYKMAHRYVSPEYFWTKKDHEQFDNLPPHSKGPVGWIGPGRGKEPEYAYSPEIYIEGSQDFLNLVQDILNMYQIESKTNTKKSIIKTELKKRSYFDQVFAILKDHNPDLEENDLMYTDEHAGYVNELFYDKVYEYSPNCNYLEFRLLPDLPDKLYYTNYQKAVKELIRL